MKPYANVLAALILSASIAGAAWFLSLNGRYTPVGEGTILDTRTGEACYGVNLERSRCWNPRAAP
jgi:hypothetical protein